jgi:DNA recombination protein RmuC
MEIVIGIIGLVVGAVVGLVFYRQAATLRAESSALRDDLDEVRASVQQLDLARNTAETQLEGTGAQIETLTGERDEARHSLNLRTEELSSTSSKLAQAEEARDSLTAQLAERTTERDSAREQLETSSASLSERTARLAEVEADHAARLEEIETYRSELEERFKGIATNVTQATREDFIKEFRDLTNEEADKSSKRIDDTVKPLKESIDKLDKQTQQMEQVRQKAYGSVEEMIAGTGRQLIQLNDATSGLRRALSAPLPRGRWGELTLERVLEVAGMREHVNYTKQAHTATEDGTVRPDAIIHLPRGLTVPVDAKTPLDAYLRSHETNDNAEQRQALEQHARSLMQHARSLGSKGYADAIEGVSPDFVVLFVPTETILDAAMTARPGIWEDAWSQHRVLIATPGLLIALLRTVGVAWQQEDIQQNAREIADAARELYTRLSSYTIHIDSLGKALETALRTYDKSVGSYQRNVLPQARRMESLGVIDESKQIDEPRLIKQSVRQLEAPELDASLTSGEAAD